MREKIVIANRDFLFSKNTDNSKKVNAFCWGITNCQYFSSVPDNSIKINKKFNNIIKVYLLKYWENFIIFFPKKLDILTIKKHIYCPET